MLRYVTVFFLILTTISAQGHKFALIVNPEIDGVEISESLSEVISKINMNKEIDFTIISGNITKSGKSSELNNAFNIFNQLEKKVHIIPGSNDTKFSVDGGMIFRELWEDDRFSFAVDSTLYIGFNSTVYYNSNQSHVAVETLSWLAEELSEAGKDRNIIIISNNPLNESTDNYATLLNILKEFNVSLCLFDNGPFGKSSKTNGIQHYTGIPIDYSSKKKGGFTLITNHENKITIKNKRIGKNAKIDLIIDTKLKPHVKEISTPKFENVATLILWQKDLGYTNLVPPVVYNKKIFTVDRSGLVTALNSKGKTLWEYDVFGDVVSKPTAADGLLAVATTQGDLNTIEIKSGESIQTIGFDEALTAPLLVFDYKGNKPRMIPKTTKSNSAIVVATDKGKVYCLDLETLEELWVNNDAKDAVISQPIFVDNKILFTSQDNTLYCVDAREGWMLWKWQPGGKGEKSITASSLVVNKTNIFLPCTNGNVYAIDIKLGKQNWVSKNRRAWETIAISKDLKKLYVKGTKDNLHILSVSNGKLIKTVGMKYGHDRLHSNPYPDEKVIFVTAENSLLYRINNKYSYKTIIKMLPAPLHPVVPVKDSEYILSDYDGKLIYFKF